MTRTKKTVFAAILSMLVIAIGLAVFFVFPISAADSGTCGEGAVWMLDDNGVLTVGLAEGYDSAAMDDYSSGGAPWMAYR